MADDLVRHHDEMLAAGQAVTEFYRAHQQVAGRARLSDEEAATWQRLLDDAIDAARAFAAAGREAFKR